MTTEEKYDTLHKIGLSLFEQNWLFVNERIIDVCQANDINYKDKKNVIPFFQLVIQLKRDDI